MLEREEMPVSGNQPFFPLYDNANRIIRVIVKLFYINPFDFDMA